MSITVYDHGLIRSGKQVVKRRISIPTRESVFSAVVTGIVRDDVSNAIIAIEYDTATGDYADIEPGMTLDVGTTAGAYDVGMVRIRGFATSDTILIAETGFSLLPVEVGDHLTARMEFRLHRVLPRGVGERTDGATYTNDFTLYMDYDDAYSDQNDSPPPKANITRSATSQLAPKPAGWTDDTDYRLVTVSSAKSEAYNGKTITSRLWAIGDCTLDTGYALTDTTVVLKVPAGFRYIKLEVTDSDGKTGLMRYPLWAHDDAYLPLTSFSVVSDDSDTLGTTMNFEFYGEDDSVDESVLPPGTLLCYWEEAKFFNTAPPDLYRDSYLGWVNRVATTLKIGKRSTHRVETAGVGWWLNAMGGSSLYIYDPGETPDKWYEMQTITCDKVAYFILKWFSNALELCNFYGGSNTYRSKGEEISMGTVWQQLNYMLDGYKGIAVPDSLNGIWVTRQYMYKNDVERGITDDAASMTSADLEGDTGFVWAQNFVQTVQAIGGGSTYDGTTQMLFASAAPLAPGYGASIDNSLAVRLNTSDPQLELNELTGQRRAELDNPNRDLTIDTLLNFDVFEMAYGEPIAFTYAHPNIAGLSILTKLVIRSISRSHSSDFREQPKRLSIRVDAVPAWTVGDTKPVEDDSIDDWGGGGGDPPVIVLPPPVDWSGDGIPSGAVVLAYFGTDNYVYITRNYRATNPTWSRYALSLDGTLIAFVVDARSPLYMGSGTAVHGWIATTTKIYKIEDIFGARTLTASFTFRSTSSLRSMDFSYGAANRGLVVTNYNDGVYETHTSDGSSWSSEALISGHLGNSKTLVATGGALGIAVNPCGTVLSYEGSGEWVVQGESNGGGYYSFVGALSDSSCFDFQTRAWSIPFGFGGGHSYINCSGTPVGSGSFHNNTSFGFITSGLMFRIDWNAYYPPTFRVRVDGWVDDDGSAYQPGAFLGSSLVGLAYTTAKNSTVQGGYKDASAYGASFSLDSTAWGHGGHAAGDIYAGYGGETTLFYGATVSGERRLYRRRSGIDSDVSPSYGGTKYGPWQSRHQIYVYPLNSSIVICVGGNADQSLCGVWVSRNEGATWTNIVTPSSSSDRIERAAFSGDDPDVIYLYGKTGKNYISTDFGVTLKERTGNIAQMASVGTFVNLCGGA